MDIDLHGILLRASVKVDPEAGGISFEAAKPVAVKIGVINAIDQEEIFAVQLPHVIKVFAVTARSVKIPFEGCVVYQKLIVGHLNDQ